jgi:hypothetical protein
MQIQLSSHVACLMCGYRHFRTHIQVAHIGDVNLIWKAAANLLSKRLAVAALIRNLIRSTIAKLAAMSVKLLRLKMKVRVAYDVYKDDDIVQR